MNYEQLFKRTLLREEGEPLQTPVNVSPDQNQEVPEDQETSPSDEEAWKDSNPDIAEKPELGAQFDVQGLGRAEIEKYSEIIANWGGGIETAIQQLAQVIKFAAGEKLANAPGSEQFSALIKDAPKLKRDLAAFKSQVEDLEQTVKLAINDAAKERKNTINSLKD